MKHRIELLNLIIKHLLPLEETHGMHIFLEDSPHVEWVNVRIYAQKWNGLDNAFFETRFAYDPGTDFPLTYETLMLEVREGIIKGQKEYLESKKERTLKRIEDLKKEQETLLSELNKGEC